MHQKPELHSLRSPEQIDRLLHVIHVPLWIALFVVVGLVTGVLLWACLARLPIFVSGMGVLFDPASVYVIQPNLTGNIQEILIATEDTVSVGSPLFILDNPAERRELQEVEKQITFLESKGEGATSELFALQMQKEQLQASLQALVIRSPVQGVVLSLNAARGELIEPSRILAWLHETDQGEKMTFYSFFPADTGALIHAGMQAHIAFKSVDSKQYGKMVGTVQKVIPLTGGQEGEMFQSLPSEEWRAMLSGNKAVYTVVVDPTTSPSTPSGYQWTSLRGPPFKVPRNALVEMTILLEKQRPINYLIPMGP